MLTPSSVPLLHIYIYTYIILSGMRQLPRYDNQLHPVTIIPFCSGVGLLGLF